jgi:aspartate carbamoyltransferase regulatory subunit
MKIVRCENIDCAQRFSVVEFGRTRPAQPEPRKIVCPYCGHVTYEQTRGAFIVTALEVELMPLNNEE